MSSSRSGFEYILLFLPYLVAELLSYEPTTSYLVAWMGSFVIFYLSLSGKVKPLPEDRSFARQIFRPLGLTQLTFAGFNAVSSIFYFLSLNGYYYFSHDPFSIAPAQELAYAAAAQRYYVLAHAAFTAGVLLAMNYRKSGSWKIRTSLRLPHLMLVVAGVTLALAIGLRSVPGLTQLQLRFTMLALVASVLSFALSIRQGQWGLILINAGVYTANVIQALLSGWKEEVIVIFLLLAMFLYPFYKRTVAAVAPIALAVLLFLLPTYVNTVRELNWRGDASAQQAAQVAYRQVVEGEREVILENNWQFLTQRISEINLFTDYLRSVPMQRDFYGWQITIQSVESLVPRVFWPGKPNTERRIMQRVYENNVVSSASNVSAKPQYVVDGYLSGGALGVFFGCLLFGVMASWASRLAERWFGGYLMGSGLLYTALFREMWTGSAFEFFFNTIVWSFIIMYALFLAGRYLGFIVPAESQTRAPRRSPVHTR